MIKFNVLSIQRMNLFRFGRRCYSSTFVLLLHSYKHITIRSLCSLVAWSLLSLLFVSSLWQFLCVLFHSASSSWKTDEPLVVWTEFTPPIHCFPNSTWGIPELWPAYIAARVLPERDLTVFIFSSQSPLPTAPHLNDPAFILQRKQVNDLLIAGLHGLVSHIIWVYPSWRHQNFSEVHSVTEFELGLARVSFADVDLFVQPGYTPGFDDPDRSTTSLEFTTLCLCPTSGSLCTLPLLSSFNIPRETCSRNATIMYEQMMDLVAESKLVQTTTQAVSTKQDPQVQSSWKVTPDQSHQTKTPPWPSNSRFTFKQWPTVFVLESSYFGWTETETQPVSFPPSPTLIEFNRLTQNLIVALSGFLDPIQSPYRITDRFLALVISNIPLNASLLVTDSSTEDCVCISPPFELSVSKEQDRIVSNWAAKLSAFTNNHSDTCRRMQPVAETLLSLDPLSPSVTMAALDLWHWLCHLNVQDILSIVSWVPCPDSPLSQHGVQLCPRQTASQPPSNGVQALEQALIFARLTSIIWHLPMPRLINMVGNPKTSLSNEERNWLLFGELCDLFIRRL